MNNHSVNGGSGRLKSRQQGVALLVGLILLLALTMIGIVAVRSSTQQGRMALNYQQQAQTFQSAESAIRLIMAQLQGSPGTNLSLAIMNTDLLSNALATAPNPALSAATATPPALPSGAANIVASTAASSGVGYNSNANVYSTGICGDGTSLCPMMSGFSLGKYTAFSFEINSVATQPATMAQSNNVQGVVFVAPKQSN